MTEENADGKRAQALELCKQAIAEHAEVSGSQIVFKRDIPLTGRPGRPVMHEGIYFILDEEGTLGYVDTEALARSLEAVREEAKRRGAYEEHEVDGMTVATIGEGGDKSPIEFQATVIPLEAAGKPVTASEAAAYLAIDTAENEETKRFIFETLFKADDSEHLPSITTEPVEKSAFPLDKVNSNVWKLLEGTADGQVGADLEGAFEMGFNVARSGSGQKVIVTYSIDFSDLEDSITKRLQPFDKRVCIAVAALFNAGYEYMTLQQIYEVMGNKGKAGKADKERIFASITKMDGAKIKLSNVMEAAEYNREEFEYVGRVLNMEWVTGRVNGQLTESLLHVFREPAPISFAKARGQFTTISVAVLDTPLSKTDGNIKIEDYLIERIAHMKSDNGATSNKILYSTLYKNTDISTRKQIQRAHDKIEVTLDHYKKCGHIKGYRLEDDGIVIIY